MTMHVRRLILAAALAALPAAASAQATPSARIDAALRTAAQAQIPVSLLQSKIDEGRAKNVPEARIAAAVEARLAALQRASQALAAARASAITSGELAIAADAIQAGVGADAVVAVMTTTPVERRAVATAVLTELVELGIASDVALSRIRAAIAQGGEALVNLPAAASQRARGRGRAGATVDVDAGIRGNDDRGRPDRSGGAGVDLPNL